MAGGDVTRRLDELANVFGFEASHAEGGSQYRLHPAWPLWIADSFSDLVSLDEGSD
jgi:hypothetical protein